MRRDAALLYFEMLKGAVAIIDVARFCEPEIERNRWAGEATRQLVQGVSQRNSLFIVTGIDSDDFSDLTIAIVEAGIEFKDFHE